MDTTLEKLAEELAAKEASTWISVKERLPEPMAIVAMIAHDGSVDEGPSMCMGWHYEHVWSTFNRCCTYISEVPNVTYWMLLPEFPVDVERRLGADSAALMAQICLGGRRKS